MNDKEKLVIAHMFEQNPHMETIDVSENKFSNGSKKMGVKPYILHHVQCKA